VCKMTSAMLAAPPRTATAILIASPASSAFGCSEDRGGEQLA